MNKIFKVFILIIVITTISVSKEVDTVSLQLKWKHQFQFAGFYMAKEKGYFKAAGLEVLIKEGKPGLDIVNEVINNKSQFGIGMPNLLIRKSNGDPIILLYPIFHHSPLIILSKQDKKINTPHDLVEKKLMLNSSRDAQIEVMLKEVGVDYSMVNIMPHSWNISDLIENNVDAMTAYSTSQPYILKEKGIDYSIMDPKNYGVDFFGDCLFSNEAFVKKNKRVTDAFISSSKEGWKYAFRNIDETVNVILKKYNTELTTEFLKFEANASQKLIDVHGEDINEKYFYENRWQYIKNVYHSNGLLNGDVNIKKFLYSMEKDPAKEKLKNRLLFVIVLAILVSLCLLVILIFNWKLRREINKSIAKEKKKNDAVLKQKHLDKLLYKTLVSINEMHELSTIEIMDYALESAVKLTDSKIGYIYFYNEETEMLTLFAWSRNVMPECKVMNPQTDYELAKTGLWGEAIRQRKPIITNNYNAPNKLKKGTPKGHVALKSHVNVPVFFEGKIIALIGVGNKKDDYTDTDVRHLSILMDGVWMIKNQREMEEKVRKINSELEDRIEERTKELKETLAKLTESEEMHRVMFETMTQGVVYQNSAGYVTRVNRAAEDILGVNIDQFQGRTSMDPRWRTIYEDGSEYPGEKHPAMLALQNGTIVRDKVMGVFNPNKDSYVWLNVTAVPLFRNEEVKPYQVYATLEDITEKRKVALELKKAKENAEKANKAKSEFLANMSHEIRTPLNAVTGFSELLTSLIKDEKQQSYVNSIKVAGKSLLTLINDILDLSKIEAGMMEISNEPVNIKSLLDEIYSIFCAKAKHIDLDFNVNTSKDMPALLLLDETRLRQVLLNLVGNAFKFTQKGYVTVNAEIEKFTQNGNVDVVIDINDTGIGINENEQENIFESFRQQEGQNTRKFGGTGLGLSICRKLAEMMNGSISVASTPGKGSKFSVILRDISMVEEQVLQYNKSDNFNYKSIVFDNPTILIVDDIESNRDFICELLHNHNCTTLEAENGEEAIQITKYNAPDVIIMDLRMPVMDGKTATKKIKENDALKHIPIIALTASITSHELVDIKEMGFQSYLSKPINIKELFKELELVLKNKIIETKKNVLDDLSTFSNIESDMVLPLLDKLENNVLPEFTRMLKVMKMNQIKEYAEFIKKLSEKYKYHPLDSISEKLKYYVDSFDIVAIKNIENDIYSIIESLNSQKGREL